MCAETRAYCTDIFPIRPVLTVWMAERQTQMRVQLLVVAVLFRAHWHHNQTPQKGRSGDVRLPVENVLQLHTPLL